MTTINLEKLSKQLNHQKIAIIELASKGEIIFDHANKMIIQLNELRRFINK
jgi:hypothetical protein